MTQTGEPCTGCGAPRPESARFCPECGTPIAAAPEREVRKTVTLLFTDVTGSTALGEQLDPESYRAVMGRYFAVSRAAIERHGGTVEKFVGDAVLAVFGVPEVREDDALRAVRAAHELGGAVRALSAELEEDLGVRLEIRTGVNTGSVVVGAARAGGSFATGDAVNTAARLEQAAGPGEVLIGAATYALVRDAVRVHEVEPVLAKGKADPVRAFRLEGVDGAADGRRRRMDADLVGRDRETRALEDALERTVESGRGHLVTITGGPGIGKSRLVAEFVDRVDGRAEVLRGRCVSYGQGITYWPVVQLLREAGRLEGDESPEVTRHALEALLAGTAEDRDAVERLLPLMGQGGTTRSGEETAWAVSHVLEALALRRPLVVVLDDLHWAEPTLLDLLESVREETRDLPFLLVGGARPELLDEHPEWGRGSLNATVFGLEPFDVAATAAALGGLLGPGVPDAVVAEIADWSGGNPLFVEELAAHLVDTDVLVRTDTGWSLAGDLATAGVPASVSALLTARLDRLPAAERRLLERIAVIGLELTADEARLLGGEDAAALLTSLARRDLLRRVRGTGPDLWAFRHVLVREAAYDTLPKAERADLHERYAAHLAEHGEHAGAERLAFVAHHLTRAASYAGLLAPRAPETRVRADAAVRAAVEAARDARAREDLDAARALLIAVLELDAGALLRRELAMALQLVELGRFDAAGSARAVAAFEGALAALGSDATDLDRAFLRSARMSWQLTVSDTTVDPDEQLAASLDLVRLARSSGEWVAELVGLRNAADAHLVSGRWRALVPLIEQIEAVGDHHDRSEIEMWWAGQLMYGPGTMAELRAFGETRLADARSPVSRLALEATIACAALCQGDADAAPLLAEVQRGITEGHSNIETRLVVAMLSGTGGLTRTSRDLLSVEVDEMRAQGHLSFLSTYLAWLALLELELGTDPATVEPMVEEAAAHTSPYDVMSVATVEGARAVLAARRGDATEARARAEVALEVIDASDNVWQQADLRRWIAVAVADLDPPLGARLRAEARELYATKGIVTWSVMLAP